ncbi:MAG: 50S ribosomal protein L11 methyltransferase [Deltaproteobacteria bacterium]|nr:MAG: 50S ribosomal protein L11 methyltransferase [Deltaproteobacteria bacterium]
MLFFYRIDDFLAVGAPWWRRLLSRSPVSIHLRPGSSFPPNHPTTKMCLRLMLQDLRENQCRNLVDVGCGSGILSLAGLKLGVACAVGLDLCPQAISTSRANAELNQLAGRLLLVRGSAEAVAGPFDLVVANLPLVVLTEKLTELVRLSGANASLILSGFQDVDRPLMEPEMRRLGLVAERWLSEDLTFYAVPPSGSFTWMAVLARKKTSK